MRERADEIAAYIVIDVSIHSRNRDRTPDHVANPIKLNADRRNWSLQPVKDITLPLYRVPPNGSTIRGSAVFTEAIDSKPDRIHCCASSHTPRGNKDIIESQSPLTKLTKQTERSTV